MVNDPAEATSRRALQLHGPNLFAVRAAGLGDTPMPKNVSPHSSRGLPEDTLLCLSVIRLMITVQVGLAVEMFKALGVGVHVQVGCAGVTIVRGLICLERL